MPPTLKDRSGLPAPSESPERAAPVSAESSITQPVALEVPLTVNGEKIVEGSDTRQAFSERTTTVLVLANGAVIRLSASVAPGQVLSLTNEKTKKEISCQVVKSKNSRIASGYVEVEFTAPVLGFWGLRFPSERNSSPANALASAPRKFESAPTVSAEPKSTFTDAPPAAENFNTNLADAVDFKTEIKADSRPSNKADFLAPAQAPVDTGKLESNRLQEQLSALLKEEQKQSESPDLAAPSSKVEFTGTSAKVFDLASEAPVKVEALASKSDSTPIVSAAPKGPHTPATSSSFNDEEVKIPAWLEPLARNAAIPAPPAEAAASGSDEKLQELEADKIIESAPEPKHLPAPSKTSKKAARRAPVVPTFGNSLLSESTSALSKAHGSNKGIWMAIAAVLLVAAASGAWYFRDTLASLAAGRGASGSNPSPVTSALRRPAPADQSEATAAPSAFKTAAPETPNSASTAKASSDANPVTSLAASSPSQGKMQTAAITERVPKSNSTADAADTTVTLAEIVEPEKKPSLGKVRLAKPKVRRPAGAQGSGEIAPSLDDSDPLSTGENALGSNFAEGANSLAGPAAPVVVGGDVIPARMISSVPPVYPALAKTQHISGDVRVDALIDAKGRVTTMKVVSGPPLLHQAAMEALKQWKYQAASLDGKPVPMHLTVTIQFRLQ